MKSAATGDDPLQTNQAFPVVGAKKIYSIQSEVSHTNHIISIFNDSIECIFLCELLRDCGYVSIVDSRRRRTHNLPLISCSLFFSFDLRRVLCVCAHMILTVLLNSEWSKPHILVDLRLSKQGRRFTRTQFIRIHTRMNKYNKVCVTVGF